MSSVTRLHLLSQSMLNVSCQKQKHCSSVPTDSPTESPMEFEGQPRPSGACSLLAVPDLSSLDLDDDDCEVVIGIRPRSSPLPRRKGSVEEEDEEPEPPLSGSRRVSFADIKGLSLVQVKEFDTWDVPKLPECDSFEGKGQDAEEYFLSPSTFSLPLSTKELFVKVQKQKVELENIELLPGTTILKGVIRVLNISYNKAVYVRTSLDTWSSHFDLLAEYMPGSSDSLMDLFSFKLTLVPPFGEQGARVDFCLRYETPVGTFWANNNDRNYVLVCHQKVKERKEKPQKENVKKSCLKTVSQNFSTVENISTDMSRHGEEAKHISAGKSGTSEEDRQKLLTCSRRSRRKAARMARVKDYFSQKNGGADDTERDESPPESKQAAEEETPEGKQSDVRSFPEESGKSEGPHFESLETCSEPLLDVPHDTATTHDYTSNSETAKSKSISATDIPDNPLHPNDEPAPAECQNINKSVCEAEESSIAVEPANSVISAESSESLVSEANSFTFETVVAPLYHQVFGRVGSESDLGNPVLATLNVEDLTQSNPHTRRNQTSCTTRGYDDEVQGNVSKTRESHQKCLDATPSAKETRLSETANDILYHAETKKDPDDIIHSDQRRTNTSEFQMSGDAVVHPHILNTDLLNPQIPTESLQLQGKAPEDNLTHNLQEHTCTQTNLDETLTETETREVRNSLTSFMSPQPTESERVTDKSEANDCECVEETNKADGKTVTMSSTNDISEKEKLLEALHDFIPKDINNSEETENSYVSCFEFVEEKDVTTPPKSHETNKNKSHKDETKHAAEIKVIGEVSESKAISNHIHGDVFNDEDTQKIEHHEMKAAVSKLQDFGLAEVNWEMMVEEEEKSILTDEEGREEISLSTVEKDQGELEGAGRETTSEDTRDKTEMEKKEDQMMVAITTAREKENKAEDPDVLEGKHRSGDEEIREIVAGKDREEKELEYVQATKTSGEEEQTEEIKEEEQEELEKEKHLEIQEVNNGKTNVQDEEAIEEGEEMTDVDEACVEREDHVDWEGILVLESDIVRAESESMTEEVKEAGCFEERLDFTPNKMEEGLSALVNNVRNGHTPTEMQDEDIQINENVTHDPSEDARDESIAAEGGLCIFTDDPEIDQTNYDSASAESDSDDEVELYMHCLRAVHTGAQAHKDRNKDFSAGLRSYVSKGSTPMPSISESLDEEQHLSHIQEETADMQPTALRASGGQEWWKETFSCSNISKTLLYATLLVVFLVVVQRYDFLACLGLYLISVVWLYCQGEKQPGQHKQQKRLN